MSGKWRTGFVLFMYSVITKVLGSSPPTLTMHHMCNRRSYPDPFTEWKGGFLIFDSQLLPAEHVNECAIFLQTASSQGIVINFSEWMMEGNCDSVNLTIVDGELRDRSYPGKSLDGLPNPVCRSSRNPTNEVYATTDSIISIVFKGKTHYWGRYRVKFNMTFLSYSKGSCDDDDTMFKCNNNGWCIDKKFTCLNLNPCGDDSDCSAKLKTPVKTILDTIIESAQDLLWIVAVAAVCYFIIKFWRARRRRHGGFEDIPILGWFYRKLCGSSSRDQERRPSTSSRHSEHSLRDNTIVMERRSLSQSSSDEDQTEESRFANNTGYPHTDPTVPPPSYHNLPPTSSPSYLPQQDISQSDIPQTDMPPPPSYDEVMANTDNYVKHK